LTIGEIRDKQYFMDMKDPRCLLRFHRWQRRHYQDGTGVYLRCWRCGKEHEARAGDFIYM